MYNQLLGVNICLFYCKIIISQLRISVIYRVIHNLENNDRID